MFDVSSSITGYSAEDVIAVVVLGVIGGVFGGLYNHLINKLLRRYTKFNE